MSSKPTNNPPDDAASPRELPKPKLTAIARLKLFGESLVPRRPPPVVFPPPSWELEDEALGDAAKRSRSALNESNYVDQPSTTNTPTVRDGHEAVSFAQRLRGLIDSLPLPGVGGTSATEITRNGKEGSSVEGSVGGASGPPIPPGVDEELIRMLSSEEVMNGQRIETGDMARGTSSSSSRSSRIRNAEEDEETTDKGKTRPSIWNILSGLRSQAGVSAAGTEHGSTPVEADEHGVMLYAPLEPKANSQVELAESETILEYIDEPVTGGGKPVETGMAGGSSERKEEEMAGMEKRVWVPSTTELSIMTTWWGYRIYLPPPVMAKLDKTSLKASARAAMITTALKWMLDKIPIMLVPVQFRPAIKMLKSLSPVVSYIGVFIAWSWDRIRALDSGNGVVLTATWLLPVALLPMSWDAGDIYGPRVAPVGEECTESTEAESKTKKKWPW